MAIQMLMHLTDALNRTLTSVSHMEWNNFDFFQIMALGITISSHTTGSSLSSIIRTNLRRLARSPAYFDTICQRLPRHHARGETSSPENLCSHINLKLTLNDVTATIRVVVSDDTVHGVSRRFFSQLGLGTHPNRRTHWLSPFRPTTTLDPNESCLFVAAGLSADIVGSQNFQTVSTRQTPHPGN